MFIRSDAEKGLLNVTRISKELLRIDEALEEEKLVEVGVIVSIDEAQ